VIIMAGAKRNNYLKEKPTEPFRMRFSEKYAKKLVDKINKVAEDDDRSFPGVIERILVQHFNLK